MYQILKSFQGENAGKCNEAKFVVGHYRYGICKILVLFDFFIIRSSQMRQYDIHLLRYAVLVNTLNDSKTIGLSILSQFQFLSQVCMARCDHRTTRIDAEYHRWLS